MFLNYPFYKTHKEYEVLYQEYINAYTTHLAKWNHPCLNKKMLTLDEFIHKREKEEDRKLLLETKTNLRK